MRTQLTYSLKFKDTKQLQYVPHVLTFPFVAEIILRSRLHELLDAVISFPFYQAHAEILSYATVSGFLNEI